MLRKYRNFTDLVELFNRDISFVGTDEGNFNFMEGDFHSK